MNIIEAIRDPNLFRPFLADETDSLTSWKAWLVALKATWGLPIRSDYGRKLVRQCTGRDARKLPREGFSTVIFLTGRRSGKSRISAVIGAYSAVLSGADKKLAAGEVGMVPVICPSKNQGRNVTSYLRALFEAPLLKEQIVEDRQGSFSLTNNVRCEVLNADHRFTRGYTLLSVVVDEACFLGVDENSHVKSPTPNCSVLWVQR